MNRIDVVPEGKEFKVLVNFIQQGVLHKSPQLANIQAQKLHSKELPKAKIYLIKIEE